MELLKHRQVHTKAKLILDAKSTNRDIARNRESNTDNSN